MTVLQALRNLNLDAIELDEAIALYAQAKLTAEAFTEFAVEPAWLLDVKERLGKWIKERRRDAIEHELKLAIADQDKLKTMDEKRSETAARIAALRAKLA